MLGAGTINDALQVLVLNVLGHAPKDSEPYKQLPFDASKFLVTSLPMASASRCHKPVDASWIWAMAAMPQQKLAKLMMQKTNYKTENLLWNVILEQHAALWTWWQWEEDAKRLFYDNDLCIQFPAGAVVVGPFSSVCQRCHAPVKFQTSSGHGQQLLELSLCHPSFYHPNLFCQWLGLSGSCLRSSQTSEGHPKLSAQEAWLPHPETQALDHPELQIQLEVQLQELAPPAKLAETWAQVKRRNGKCEARAQVKQSAFKFFLQNLQSNQATSFACHTYHGLHCNHGCV